MSRLHLFVLTLFLMGVRMNLDAQKVWQNLILDAPQIASLKPIQIDSLFNAAIEKQNMLGKFQAQGYLFIDLVSETVSPNRDTIYAYWKLGNQFKNIRINKGNLSDEFVSELRLNLKGIVFSESNLNNLRERILQLSLNNGFPFAAVSFDSILVDSSIVSASVNLQTGPLFYFDSLDFAGTSELKLKYLRSFCNIKPGSVYNESVLKSINAMLTELPYLQITRPIGVYYYGNKAKPYVYIDKKKAGTFDGIIGFAPNSSLNNKLVITGDINLKLQNILGTGKAFEVGFRSFLNGSQDLQLKFNWPNFLNTRFGLDNSFRLLRFDSIYIDINNEVALQYRAYGKNLFKVIYQYQHVSLLNVDTISVLATKQLPAFHDVQSDLIGFSYRFNNLNHYFNPSKGNKIELEFFGGSRKIIRNSILNELKIPKADFTSYNIYDSINLQSVQLKFRFNYSGFKPIYRQFIFHYELNGAYVYAERIFQNELFRIGGLKTLRGFDEQSIFADAYLVANAEIKYLIPENSSFVLFYNKAFVRNSLVNDFRIDYPFGFGAGMNIESKAGVFSLFYALGSQKGNVLVFNSARIHFGFVNYF